MYFPLESATLVLHFLVENTHVILSSSHKLLSNEGTSVSYGHDVLKYKLRESWWGRFLFVLIHSLSYLHLQT